jgi:hypothetical protein
MIFKKIRCLGILLIWFTLNPYDLGNIFVVKLAREDVKLDDIRVKLSLLKLMLKNLGLVA